jgi:hypothetical protein
VYVLEGKTENSEIYIQVLKRLLQRISRVRVKFGENSPWFLLHDNASAYCTNIGEMLCGNLQCG